ncbi:MAG: HipA domain-containing protein [Bacteroidia bacterium]
MTNENRCLYCYQPLLSNEKNFHPACSRKIFGKAQAPELPYTEEDMLKLANQVIRSHAAVTGVQPKLSLDIEKSRPSDIPKFTIVGLWGNFILKPPTEHYPHLPELEDLTMHLASLSGIKTVPHSLIRMENNHLAYITRRIDRNKGKKLHMEDMCQLTEKLTEHKYRGSYEQIGKAILQYSANPLLDIINFFEQVIFCFLTGNADMHLKNFSLIKSSATEYTLSPAYDMVATALVVPEDAEELALTLNAKKRKIKRKDFKEAFSKFPIDIRAQENMFGRFEKALPKWFPFIEQSFLSEEMKLKYIDLVKERARRLELKIT